MYLTQSQYADTGPTSPSADLTAPVRVVTGVAILMWPVRLDLENDRGQQAGIEPRSACLEAYTLPLDQRGHPRCCVVTEWGTKNDCKGTPTHENDVKEVDH